MLNENSFLIFIIFSIFFKWRLVLYYIRLVDFRILFFIFFNNLILTYWIWVSNLWLNNLLLGLWLLNVTEVILFIDSTRWMSFQIIFIKFLIAGSVILVTAVYPLLQILFYFLLVSILLISIWIVFLIFIFIITWV